MTGFLRGATWVVLAFGVLGAVLPGDVATVAGVGAVAAVIAVPLVRVAWLARQWVLEGDDRFAGLALALLGIVATGAVLALSVT